MKGLNTAPVASKKLDSETVKKRKAGVNAKPKKEKASKKNSGAPKRPASAFFVFMEEFRKSFKENFPDNKSVSIVAKAGGEKWKSLSEMEKAPYVAKAAKKKADYEKAMDDFKLNGSTGEQKSEVSDKSSAEVHEDHDAAEQEASS